MAPELTAQGVQVVSASARPAKSLQSSLKLQPYPPRVPGSVDELKRAICLLGNRGKAELTSKAQQELIALVGNYPSVEEAAAWKQYLK